MTDLLTSGVHGVLKADDDPLFGAALALRSLELGDEGPALRLARGWSASDVRVSSNPASPLRYRWSTSTRLVDAWPPYVRERGAWAAWRPAEDEIRARDARRFEDHLIAPIVLADSVELLARVAEMEGPPTGPANRMLSEALPRARRDMAGFLAETHAWTDTWALWNLVRRSRALRLLHPFAVALADTYAERAINAGSVGTGSRFPFHDQPLVSVSAQLAAGLLAMGVHPKLTGALVNLVRQAEAADGGWADGDGPVDPLTTLVAAELLLGLDPSWDPMPALRALESMRTSDGFLTAYGPETGWLTTEVERLIERAGLPFERRFRWPQLAVQQRDRRTQLPFLGYLVDLERLYAEVASLRDAPVELAFLDLAGFGAWNNRFGMAAGDEVLRFLADELRSIPDSVAIRDGGDEFVIVGGPHGAGLATRLTAFRASFPVHFRDRFGPDALPVAPRIVTLTAVGRSLVVGRDQLGRDIAKLKERSPHPGDGGVQVTSEDLRTMGPTRLTVGRAPMADGTSLTERSNA